MQSQKALEIHKLFTGISSHYDIVNHLISMGQLTSWRKKAVQVALCGLNVRPVKILDLASGTGDLAIEFKKALGDQGDILGTDFCEAMLESAPAKAKRKGLKIAFEPADATKLSYSDNSFDVTSIAFGIRNVSSVEKALSEMTRVTAPGGRVIVLETGQTNIPVFRQMFNFYFSHIMPLLAFLLSGKYSSYRYLNQSSQTFPCGNAFEHKMNLAGNFTTVQSIPLFGGVAYLYCGIKA